jgi:hypothetical protein
MCVDASLATEVILLGSTEYLLVSISSADGGPVSPEAVEFAFPEVGTALGATPTWVAGEVIDAGAQIRIGDYQSAYPLAAGRYGVYVRVTVSPERPVRLSGQLTIREG